MNYVLYHNNCNDGMAAAYAAYKHLGNDFKYLGVQYGQPFPKLDLDKDSIVYILDFSYSRDILENLNNKIKQLLVIDHHATAQEELKGLPYCIFDMSKCGAVLTWEYFNKDTLAEKGTRTENLLYNYIQDRDLWTKKYTESDYLYSVVSVSKHFYDFDYWDKLSTNFNFLMEIIELGRSFETVMNFKRTRFAEHSKLKLISINNYKGVLFNATGDISSTSSRYLEVNTDIDFTMSYFITEECKVVYSLRSRTDSDVDVSVIAKRFNGGGHKHASGFNTSLELLKEFYK